MIHLLAARLLQHRVIGVQRSSNGKPFVACRRLNPGAAERRTAKKFSIRHAVQSASACHGQIFLSNSSMQFVEEVKEDLLEAVLHGVREIHVSLGDIGVWLAGSTKQLFHLLGKMPRKTHGSIRQYLHPLIAAERLEVAQVQLKIPVL